MIYSEGVLCTEPRALLINIQHNDLVELGSTYLYHNKIVHENKNSSVINYLDSNNGP